MLSGCRNDSPDTQLMFCSALALNALNTSTNNAKRPDRRRTAFSTRRSNERHVVHPARADRLCQYPDGAVVQRRRERASERLARLMAEERRYSQLPGRLIGAVHLRRPDPEVVAAVRAGVDQVIRRQRKHVLANLLAEISARLIVAPGVRESRDQRPPSVEALARCDVKRPVVAVGVGHVAHDVDRKLGDSARARIRRIRGPSSAVSTAPSGPGSAMPTGTTNASKGWFTSCRWKCCPLAPPHETRPHSDVRRELALHPASQLSHEWKFEPRVQLFGFDAAAAGDWLPTLLAVVPDAVAVEIRPRVASPPQARIRVRVGCGWRSRVGPILAIAELQDSSARRRRDRR